MDTAGFLAALDWLGEVGDADLDADRLSIRAGATTDWFNDPDSGAQVSSAPVLGARVAGDGQLSARVRVDFASDFDAGVLLVHQGEQDYAKLCFERAPTGENLLVSVVTRGTSDDANGPAVDGDSVMLRVSRFRSVIAFHWSVDGGTWNLLRYFRLRDPDAATSLGFVAQSPTGSGCAVTFSDIEYRAVTAGDIRDGS